MGGGPRDVAEHFMELHSSRILADERNRHHSPRKDYLQTELKVEDVISYLERLRERAERSAPPSRRTQETQTVPAALLPVPSTFLLQELPSAPAPQHLHQVNLILSDFLLMGMILASWISLLIFVKYYRLIWIILDYIEEKKKKKKKLIDYVSTFFYFFHFSHIPCVSLFSYCGFVLYTYIETREWYVSSIFQQIINHQSIKLQVIFINSEIDFFNLNNFQF